MRIYEKKGEPTRCEKIRRRTISIIYEAGAPHIGSALSCVDILSAVYSATDVSKIKKGTEDRDRVILSKGHAVAAQLATLCEYGLISNKDIDKDFCKSGSRWFENTSPYTPYIETATGSLGQGLSFGIGVALGMKYRNFHKGRVFVIMGDGECNEGQCWEAALQASRFCLDNLLVLIDANGLAGIDKTCADEKWSERFRAFGFDTMLVDGHNMQELTSALSLDHRCGKPRAVICKTVKGYGVSFMENDNVWHYRTISENDYKKICSEWKNS